MWAAVNLIGEAPCTIYVAGSDFSKQLPMRHTCTPLETVSIGSWKSYVLKLTLCCFSLYFSLPPILSYLHIAAVLRCCFFLLVSKSTKYETWLDFHHNNK